MLRPVVFALLVVCGEVAFQLSLPELKAQGTPPEQQQLLAWLRELKPLPKVHYSWPLPWERLSDELLYQYVRLTHAASVAGEWFTPEQIDRAVALCHRVNRQRPKLRASLAVNYSVWHRRFGKKLPPTDFGPSHQAELDHLRRRMLLLKKTLAEANRRHGAQVQVTAILFDSERFRIRPGDTSWNRAIAAKYDAAYHVVHSIFPQARIEWYGRGAIQRSAAPSGWSRSRWFPLLEQGKTFACSLYRVPEIGYTREAYRRTVQHALAHGVQEVTPWVALASGYRRQVDVFHRFDFDWNYDLIYSWQLGAELNQPWFGAPEREKRFAPWRRAKVIVFYPAPFDPRSPFWGLHFTAYVRGAHLIRKLPQ